MISQKIRKVASITGLLLGAFALSAIASDWGPAGCAAPGCNTGAPINVTITPQHKAGPLAVGKASDPTTGFDLDVVGVGFFGGVKVGGALEVIGNTKLKTLQIGDATPSGDKQVGYVLSKKDENGTVEWKASANQSLTVSSVAEFEIAVKRNGGLQSTTTPVPYLFCALSRVESEMGRVNADPTSSGYCQVTKNTDGKWTVSGYLANDPNYVCKMTCFK